MNANEIIGMMALACWFTGSVCFAAGWALRSMVGR